MNGENSRFYRPGSRQDREFRAMLMVMSAARLWTRTVEQIVSAETGQTRVRWEMLFAIATIGAPTTASAIAQRIDMQWPAMVRVLDGLEVDGLIVRRGNPEDGRSRLIELTPAGDKTVERLQATVDPVRSELFEALTDAELNELAELAGRLQSRLADRRRQA